MRTEPFGNRNASSESGSGRAAPVVSVLIQPGKESGEYEPGELFTGEYRIDLRNGAPAANVIETSVLWRTEGKGDTDIGVHFFERREKKMANPEMLRQTHRLSTVLPATPLSYAGRIVKIVWCVRVRIFFEDGSEITNDKTFRVGKANPVEAADSISTDSAEIEPASNASE